MPTQPIRVLLVEDDPVSQSVFESVANQIPGLSTVVVGTRAEINGELRTCDVMVLDLSLPDSTCHETMSELAKYVKTIPVVVYTANASPELMERVGAAGASGYLEKQDLTKDRVSNAVLFAKGLGHRKRVIDTEEQKHKESLVQRAMKIGRYEDCSSLSRA